MARKVVVLEHAPWTFEFPSSLICALLWPFYSGTKPTRYSLSIHTILAFVHVVIIILLVYVVK